MLSFSFNMYRVGQSYICTVHIWYGWQGNHLTYGRLTYGHLTYGHLTYGHLTYGHLTHGHLTYGHLTHGHLTYGHLTYGHLTYGHLRCVHTVLANPKYTCHTLQLNGEYLLIVVKRVTVALAVCPKYIFI